MNDRITGTDGALLGVVELCGRSLGALFLTSPRDEVFEALREALLSMRSFDKWPFGAEERLADAWRLISDGLVTEDDDLAREYQRLFIGPYQFKAPAWGSVYLDKDGVLYGSSTFELRCWMRDNGLVRTDEAREPEDHIGRMLFLMGWLAGKRPKLLSEFLALHLLPWAPRYFELLSEDARHPFYKGLGILADETLSGVAKALGVSAVEMKLYR